MLFPKAKRVIYGQNPLTSVICQLRFPPILSIETDVPATFQDRVRHEFPLYEVVHDSAELTLPDSIAQIVPNELKQSLTRQSDRRHQLATKNRNWSLSLTKEFLALEAKDYTQWEDFSNYLELAVESLIDVYAPAHFSRIGLRYQNIIDRDKLKLVRIPWHQLLSSIVLGPLGGKHSFSNVIEYHGTFSLKLNEDREYVRVQYGLGSESGDESTRLKYLLDNDFYTDMEIPAEAKLVVTKTDEFNRHNRNLFQSCIAEKLHSAMGPQDP